VLDRDVGLDIAARLFWERGYEGTSTSDLTKAMGINPPTLYSMFGSKEELYRQALDFSIARENSRRLEMLRSNLPVLPHRHADQQMVETTQMAAAAARHAAHAGGTLCRP